MIIPFVSFAPMQKELKEEMLNKFEEMYDKAYYIQGNEYDKFQEQFANYIGTKYAVGVGNGLDALMLILRAMEIGAGDE